MDVFSRNAAFRLAIGFAIAIALCMGLPLVLSPFRMVKREISAPDFLRSETGISMGDGWSEVDSEDEHGGLVGDGETFAVFQLTQPAIDKLIESAPPWSASWQSGPVPGEIGFHCDFGTDGVAFGGPIGQPGTYSGDDSLVRLLSSKGVLYDAKERCCDGLPWHNGHLIVIDPDTKTVWLSVWNF